jgi:hypothetical protein
MDESETNRLRQALKIVQVSTADSGSAVHHATAGVLSELTGTATNTQPEPSVVVSYDAIADALDRAVSSAGDLASRIGSPGSLTIRGHAVRVVQETESAARAMAEARRWDWTVWDQALPNLGPSPVGSNTLDAARDRETLARALELFALAGAALPAGTADRQVLEAAFVDLAQELVIYRWCTDPGLDGD